MSNTILIIGEPGSGKSTSIRTLDPTSTFIINVIGKPLPFRGYKSRYTPLSGWSDTENNLYRSSNYQQVLKCIDLVNRRTEIKCLIIDDFQYIMASEFMARATEKGFEKFSELGNHIWQIINALSSLREDLLVVVMSHSDTDEYGKVKCKTIGKLLNEKLSIEGMFTTVFHSLIVDKVHKFLTQNDGHYVAKSPMGMFEDELIPNDLALVKAAVESYYSEGEEDDV